MSANASAVRAATAQPSARARFIRETYLYVALAIAAFAVVEWGLLQWSGAVDLARKMTNGYNWLLVLLIFMLVSSFADRLARSTTSTATVYAGFALFIVAEAVLFLPLMIGIADSADNVLPSAALITTLLVAGLTAVVVVTQTDFSFLRSALVIGGFLALGLIVASILFGFSLGIVFSLAMVAFAAASVLYHTSGIMQTYNTDQPVAAGLALFASIALLFWYVVQALGFARR
jgi:uncharacterized protein